MKKNISYLTTTGAGIKLYSFEYIWSKQKYVGVMAQDLTESHPEALSTDNFGFYKVDYGVLGLKMYTLEAWRSLPHELEEDPQRYCTKVK
ncbi:tail fiber domain-containing protein [Candidatus Saccharibacteria bacterium]|nr:tail fiber domain-containing protein [Candidatus Saccharibacteria bacterium]